MTKQDFFLFVLVLHVHSFGFIKNFIFVLTFKIINRMLKAIQVGVALGFV